MADLKLKRWLGIEDSNLCFLSQSQASYHWTNPHCAEGMGPGSYGGGSQYQVPNTIIVLMGSICCQGPDTGSA